MNSHQCNIDEVIKKFKFCDFRFCGNIGENYHFDADHDGLSVNLCTDLSITLSYRRTDILENILYSKITNKLTYWFNGSVVMNFSWDIPSSEEEHFMQGTVVPDLIYPSYESFNNIIDMYNDFETKGKKYYKSRRKK